MKQVNHWFFLSVFVSGFLALCSQTSVWAASVFDGVPKAVGLPDPTKGDEVTLLPLDIGGKPLTLTLLGGETAIPQKGAAKKKKKDADDAGEVEVTGYTLEPENVKKEGTACWKIKYNLKGREATCVTLKHDGKKLSFKWRTKVPQNLLLPIANCVLKFTSGQDTHYLALREPLKIENITLNQKTGVGMLKTERLDYPLPELETVFFEIQSLGTHKPGEANIILPPAAKLSEISSKEPMKILFNFKDSNGNTKTAFSLDIRPTIAASIMVSVEPPKDTAKVFSMMFQQAQDPQIDILLNKNRKEITNINQKLEKEQGWKRDAKDTNRISELQTQNWGFEQLRALAKSEAKMRIYIDYGETQVNILETQPLTEEQKAARQEKKKPKKKTESGASAGPQDDGGFKF